MLSIFTLAFAVSLASAFTQKQHTHPYAGTNAHAHTLTQTPSPSPLFYCSFSCLLLLAHSQMDICQTHCSVQAAPWETHTYTVTAGVYRTDTCTISYIFRWYRSDKRCVECTDCTRWILLLPLYHISLINRSDQYIQELWVPIADCRYQCIPEPLWLKKKYHTPQSLL